MCRCVALTQYLHYVSGPWHFIFNNNFFVLTVNERNLSNKSTNVGFCFACFKKIPWLRNWYILKCTLLWCFSAAWSRLFLLSSQCNCSQTSRLLICEGSGWVVEYHGKWRQLKKCSLLEVGEMDERVEIGAIQPPHRVKWTQGLHKIHRNQSQKLASLKPFILMPRFSDRNRWFIVSLFPFILFAAEEKQHFFDLLNQRLRLLFGFHPVYIALWVV